MTPHAEAPLDAKHLNGVNGIAERPKSTVNGNARTSDVSAATKSQLRRGHDDDMFDLVCVGFGPANLALAIALNDALESQHPPPRLARFHRRPPKILFLERQCRFGWHKGMLLPGAKMQISFVKDLATLRNPKSEFTFLNYLHKQNRLASFTNLNTFLPQRVEYEHYMKWCATAFEDVVQYNQNVMHIHPARHSEPKGATMIKSFEVLVKDLSSDVIRTLRSRNIVMAVGGKPQIPESFPQHHPRIFHSAHYATSVEHILPDKLAPYTLAVVGCGQSAAEIFNDLQSKFPNSKTRLFIKGPALRPSDDSPFVNEIFDPDKIDTFYDQAAEQRQASIAQDRGTNYGVVRIELLEHIYETLYMQRLANSNTEAWPHQIMPHRTIVGAHPSENSVRLRIRTSQPCSDQLPSVEEFMDVDALIVATGYARDMHEDILKPVRDLRIPKQKEGQGWSVTRDYKVELDKSKVANDAGIWLSGCNEQTHGLSDTLLSVLATRGAELIQSIFGD